jgi:hypothetical protein
MKKHYKNFHLIIFFQPFRALFKLLNVFHVLEFSSLRGENFAENVKFWSRNVKKLLMKLFAILWRENLKQIRGNFKEFYEFI